MEINYEKLKDEGRLIILPCKPSKMVYVIEYRYTKCTQYGEEFDEYNCQGCESLECDSKKEWYINEVCPPLLWIIKRLNDFGSTVFVKEEDAKAELKRRCEQ